MARKRRSSPTSSQAPRILAALAALALVIFLGGELFAFATSDHGRVFTWRHLHVGDRDRVVRITGQGVREGLAAARVPKSAWDEQATAGRDGGTPLWTVHLPADGSPMQVNYAITEAVAKGGIEVLSGREEPGPDGGTAVRLTLGVPGRTLHEVLITRPARAHHPAEPAPAARLALVLVVAGDDLPEARALLARREPFTVAVPAIGDARETLRREARAGGHELVLQVPMEPENYPRVNPGPGTLLVSMGGRKIQGLLHDDLDEAGDGVIAVTNFMGSFATQDEPFMTAFYRELKRQNLPFLHVGPVPRSVCRELAARVGVAYDEPDANLDLEAREPRPAALERAFKAALERAERRGHSIVVLRVTPLSAAWLERALEPGAMGSVTLVPLSSLLHRAGP